MSNFAIQFIFILLFFSIICFAMFAFEEEMKYPGRVKSYCNYKFDNCEKGYAGLQGYNDTHMCILNEGVEGISDLVTEDCIEIEVDKISAYDVINNTFGRFVE